MKAKVAKDILELIRDNIEKPIPKITRTGLAITALTGGIEALESAEKIKQKFIDGMDVRYQGDDALYDCAITGKMVPINGGRYGEKPDWCPLRELPEKKEELQNENYEFGSLGKAFTAGFNACLYEILK